MSTQTEAMKLALEALETVAKQPVGKGTVDAITALQEALAEQPAQQEPVAWVDVKHTDFGPYDFHGKELLPVGRHDLYTTPQAQPAPEIAIADAYRAGVDSGIAAEREACAKVCDDWPNGREDVYSIGVAIRARSST